MSLFANSRIPVFILIAGVVIVYSNSLAASWHLDDYRNIVHDPGIHITDLKPASLYQTFFKQTGDDTKVLYRPLARLSLALNWYAGGEKVVGYHVVNIGIHLATALLLYFTVLALLNTPRVQHRYADHEKTIALTATLLWALNPVQTQAVTYIVQRMAALATLFYLVSLFAYLQAKTKPLESQRWFWYLLAGCGFLLALASKENVILLPIVILLVEVIFYNGGSAKRNRHLLTVVVLVGLLVAVCGLLLLVVWKGDPLAYMHSRYATRPFTLAERLMTQPRVIIFYLSLIFWPLPSRLAIEHNFAVSESLLVPWTTLPAMLMVVLLLLLAVSQIKKRPFVAWGFLFFLVNHLIESSVFPLELVFEHRNYLPSLFIFVPLAAFAVGGLQHVGRRRTAWLPVVVASLTVLVLVGLGTGTYYRNRAWRTEKTLWEDAVVKAPGSGRAYHNLAWAHYHAKGQFQQALKLYKQAIVLRGPENVRNFATWVNIASIYYTTGDYARAVEFFKRAGMIKPHSNRAKLGLARALIKTGAFETAGQVLDDLLKRQPANADYLNLKGFVLLKKDDPAQALAFFRETLTLNPTLGDVWLNMGVAFGLMGQYRQGRFFLRQAERRHDNAGLVLLGLVENSIQREDRAGAAKYAACFLGNIKAAQVSTWLEDLFADNLTVPLKRELIVPAIATAIIAMAPEPAGR
jgi:Tfp pilus assembly protein PilF